MIRIDFLWALLNKYYKKEKSQHANKNEKKSPKFRALHIWKSQLFLERWIKKKKALGKNDVVKNDQLNKVIQSKAHFQSLALK